MPSALRPMDNKLDTELSSAIKRRLLKPLVRRSKDNFSTNANFQALVRLMERASASAEVEQITKLMKDEAALGSLGYSTEFCDLTKALYHSNRITLQQYVFYANSVVEDALTEKVYERKSYPDLEKISDDIRSIEFDAGLSEDEYWLKSEGPPDWQELNSDFDRLYDEKRKELFREFGFDELLELYSQRDRFDLLRERGRRTIFHRSEMLHVLRDVILQYEAEAKVSFDSGAYCAAIVTLGAAMEGLLLLRCLKSPFKAQRVARRIPKSKRPRFLNDIETWSFDCLIRVCLEAEWLRDIHTETIGFRASALAHYLRELRNYVHPGRFIRERPWLKLEKREYLDAEAVYRTLLLSLGEVRLNNSSRTE